ncbi:hypothetical protein ANN_03689 [Periplaneta americana]|uniref:Arginyl tRNA synthetase N-terminal domain-containing protein n=1 Tax=Periplaneta americana TaxID=6978 RepID=A0ABQ8TZI6_PERAM|nr:hypothetical protein ANN_03689 [Periplaneta americana]
MEEEIRFLVKEIENLKRGNSCSSDGVPPELAELLLQNTKLKHRLAILKRACEAQELKTKSGKFGGEAKMESIQEQLVHTFTKAVESAFPDVPDVGVPVVPSPKFGDYQCNAAMQLTQLLKGQGIFHSSLIYYSKLSV